MTNEQITERGYAAKALLNDPTFKSFLEETRQLILESIGNTQPEASAERETLYLRYNALTDLMSTMQSYVDAADAIRTAHEQEDFD